MVNLPLCNGKLAVHVVCQFCSNPNTTSSWEISLYCKWHSIDGTNKHYNYTVIDLVVIAELGPLLLLPLSNTDVSRFVRLAELVIEDVL